MMRRPAQWFGILVLALALVPGQLSTTDAGVIPWVYDSIFGPVRPYGYGYSGYGYSSGGYGVSYRYPYAGQQISYMAPGYYRSSNCGPAGCGPAGCATPSYTVGYRSILSTSGCCTTSGCSSVLAGYRYSSGSCGTCSTVASASGICEAQTSWKSKEAKTEWKAEVVRGEAAVPTPAAKDEAPQPRKTFTDEPAASSEGQPMAVEKVVAEEHGEAATAGKPAAGDPNWNSTGKPAAGVAAEVESSPGNAKVSGKAATSENTGFGETLRGDEVDPAKGFAEPLKGVESAVEGDAVPTTTPVLPEGLENTPVEPLKESAPGLDINNLPLDLENKSSWKFEVPVRRIAFRAGFSRASLARSTVKVDIDYVVSTTAPLRLVSR